MWIVTALITLVSFYIWKRIRSHHRNLPPGPLNIPLLGSWEFIKLYLCDGNLSEMYARLGKKYGPVIFMRTAMDTPVVAIRTYDAVKESAKDIRLNGVAVPYLYRLMNEWVNYGISFADGKHWRNNKKFTIANLGKLGVTKERVQTLATYECSNAVEKLIALKGQPVNIEHQLFGAITNVIMEILMSRRFDIDDPLFRQMREDGFTLFSIAAKFQTYLDFAPWLSRFASENSDSKTLARIMNRFYVFCDKVIADHQENLNVDEPRDLVDAYLAVSHNPHEGVDMSVANLRVMLKDLIIGGMEGPSIILAWLMLLIAEYSDVQTKMTAEVDAVIGTERPPTLEDQHACPYIRAVIYETFRFVTLTPVHRHFASYGDTTLLGYHIPAGSLVLEDIHSVNHDPAVWGDPAVFRPDRFLGSEGERLQKHEGTLGFGPRQCPGATYSHTVLFLFAAGLLQRLRLQLPEGAEKQTSRGAYNVGVRPSQPMVIALPR